MNCCKKPCNRTGLILGLLTLFLALLLILLGGCATDPQRPANRIIEDALQGGSTLAMSQDSTRVAGGSWSGEIRIWNLESGRELGSWKEHVSSVNGLFFINSDSELVSAGYDGFVRIWSTAGIKKREWHSGSPIMGADLDRQRMQLLTGHKDGSVKLWQLPQGNKLHDWNIHSDALRNVAIDSRNRRYASTDSDARTAVWTLDSSPRFLDTAPSDSRSIAFSPDGTRLLGAGWFKLFSWNLADGKLTTLDTDHQGIINSIEFMSDGRLATISRQTDSAVLFLDAATGETVERFNQHDLCGVAATVSPDGNFLATTSDDASLRIWKLPSINQAGR